MTGLVDCNNFFVSCERTVHPELIGKAVVVLSNNDGCIIARSNEAKALGIRMGQPFFEVKDMVRSGKLTALSGHHQMYQAISRQVHDIFHRYVPRCIDYSIDEAFLDFSGFPVAELEYIGTHLANACMEEARIPVTVGIAPTKTLAKLVTHCCKRSGRNVGVAASASELDATLRQIAVNEIWGIGRRLGKRLYASGIFTADQLAAKDVGWVRASMGVVGERLWRELHGEPCVELEALDRIEQEMISHTRTFPSDTDDYEYIRERVCWFAEQCASKMRQMKARCRRIEVFLRGNRFNDSTAWFRPSAAATFALPTADAGEIITAALRLLDSIFDPDALVKRAGVMLSEFSYARAYTPSLFEAPAKELKRRNSMPLQKAIDEINKRYPRCCSSAATHSIDNSKPLSGYEKENLEARKLVFGGASHECIDPRIFPV